MFLNDVYRDMTQKAGQKCTAIRRVLVPEAAADGVKDGLAARLADTKIGDPTLDGVRIGPLASRDAREAVRAGLAALEKDARVVFRGEPTFACRAGFAGKGYFQAPVLLEVAPGAAADAVHEVEVFGPVATVIPYRDAAEAVAGVRRGGGGLVASVYSDDRAFLKEAVRGIAASHGRVFVGSKKVAGAAAGPGTALPQLQHGGPGRAGGGSELGGLRGLHFYMQRVALQGYGPLLDWLGT
jgi:oxepin-CoA hydrolase/3-oxo-5,6-dehydrosuberyl-CoA semialdehyde dehydrogenase